MSENEIARLIVDAAFRIHRDLGTGLFESVYEAVLAKELTEMGLRVARQRSVPIRWKDLHFEDGFRADLIVNELVIVELKSVLSEHAAHKKQLLTYLRLADKRLGILINFAEPYFKDAICRVVNGLPEPATLMPHEHDLEELIR